MLESASFDTVSVTVDGDVTTLTLDRPEKKNAINPAMIHEMQAEVFPRLEADARDPEGGTNVLVVTGAGDAFCAGMDLEEFFLENIDDPALMTELVRLNMEWFEALYRFPRATIAAVNGWCFGGGLALQCACDLAVAAEDARMGLSEVRWGILPAGGATYLPARTVGRRDFLEASLMGRDFDGTHAEEIRMVNEAVPAEALESEVAAWAEEVASLNPTTVQYAKEVFQHEEEGVFTFDAAVTYEIARNRQLRAVTSGEDVKALQAFSDKKFRPGVETYTDEDIEDYDD